jgi:hypothetical protein
MSSIPFDEMEDSEVILFIRDWKDWEGEVVLSFVHQDDVPDTKTFEALLQSRDIGAYIMKDGQESPRSVSHIDSADSACGILCPHTGAALPDACFCFCF